MTRLFLGLCFINWALLAGCQSQETTPPAQKSAAEPARSQLTKKERRARFARRTSVATPQSLPGPWQTLLKTLDHKLVSAAIERSSYQSDWRGGIKVKLNFRLFGLDREVDQALGDALSRLKLPGLKKPLKSQTVDAERKGWTLALDRMVAPKGMARQTAVELSWYRRPKPTTKRGRCHKPHPVDMDGKIPNWVRRTLSKRSTRRCIYSEVELHDSGVTGRMRMLYHNGFAHDENVGQLAAAAAKAGFRKESGEGPNQQFSGPKGQSLTLSTVRAPHDMGCEPKGPILEIEWARSDG